MPTTPNFNIDYEPIALATAGPLAKDHMVGHLGHTLCNRRIRADWWWVRPQWDRSRRAQPDLCGTCTAIYNRRAS